MGQKKEKGGQKPTNNKQTTKNKEGRVKEKGKKEGIKIGVWNKGGSWDTTFNAEIEIYLKKHNLCILGVT